MSRGLKLRHFFLITALATVLSFQNCAQPAEDMSALEQSSYEDGLPHAYEAKLDTIAYMSCSEMDNYIKQGIVEKRAYFSFRAGAYSSLTGGLSLTDDFLNQTKYYTLNERARVLSEGATNADMLLSLSIRRVGDYQSAYFVGQGVANEEDLSAFLPDLGSSVIAGPMAAQAAGTRRNYFPGDFDKRLIEASLRMYEFENKAVEVRNMLHSGEVQLVAGYTGSTALTDTVLRTPDSSNPDRAYGVGYQLQFGFPFNYTGERRVLATGNSISERNLATGNIQSSSWDCSANYQFVVVRPEDVAAGRVVCGTSVDRYADATQQAALSAIRRVLRVEDWFVDLTRKCVVPKRTGDMCYGNLMGPTNVQKVIQYGISNCLNGDTTTCPHFVSVCIRQ